jgi:acetyltransferase-like isoleucine patch superfamily enzyme
VSATAGLKRAANAALRLAVTPLVAAYRAEVALAPAARRERVFQAWSQTLSLVPGLTGQFLRRAFYGAVLPECHERSCIEWGTVFSSRELYVGEGVYVGARCMLGRARLERHVTIGSNVDVLSGRRQHVFDDPTRPVQEQGGTFELVTIGENSWIGNGAVVLCDVGRRAVVAAGSVVVHPVPDDAIVAGNPARVVRTRALARDGGRGGGDRPVPA